MLMNNNVFLVGRTVADPEIKELEDGKRVCNMTLAVPRSYKNAEGVYETDFVDCTLWGGIAETTTEYITKGDMIGVRGRIESRFYEKEDGTKQKVMSVIADKVSFLSSKAKEMIQPDDEPEMA